MGPITCNIKKIRESRKSKGHTNKTLKSNFFYQSRAKFGGILIEKRDSTKSSQIKS